MCRCPQCGFESSEYRAQRVAEQARRIRARLDEMGAPADWNDEMSDAAAASLCEMDLGPMRTRRSEGRFPLGRKAGRHRVYSVSEIAEHIVYPLDFYE